MNIATAKLVYFTPTHTTRRVLEGIARGIQSPRIDRLDLTPPASRTQTWHDLHGELAIVGAPVYGGRIPLDAVQRLRRLKAKDTPAAIVVVYGNRAYEDALLELRDLVLEAGFTPVAGGAFVGEHSFSTDAMPIAHGRPDAQDLAEAAAFGRQIRDKLASLHTLDGVPPLDVPGSVPYRDRGAPARISPDTQEALCVLCGTCASVCPTAAISVGTQWRSRPTGCWHEVSRGEDAVVTNPEACILCCACVKNCPTGARVMSDPRIVKTTRWLNADYSERKAPETYL